jgi:hypothetical protein
VKLSEHKNGNITEALKRSRANASNLTNCKIYPNDDLYVRATAPTWIDITISVFVIGRNSFSNERAKISIRSFFLPRIYLA